MRDSNDASTPHVGDNSATLCDPDEREAKGLVMATPRHLLSIGAFRRTR